VHNRLLRASAGLPLVLTSVVLALADVGALGVASALAWSNRRQLRALRSRLRAVPTHDAAPDRESNQAQQRPAMRQMTLGECIAVAELAHRFEREQLATVPLATIMKVVDAMAVCTTCGQPEHAHRADAAWSMACTTYAPRER